MNIDDGFFSSISKYVLPKDYDKPDCCKFLIDNEVVKIQKKYELRIIDEYCKSINENINICEEIDENSKLCFTGRFISKPDNEDLLRIIYCAQQILDEFGSEDSTDDSRICFYFQNPEFNFRIIFPFFEYDINDFPRMNEEMINMLYQRGEFDNIISDNVDNYRPLYRSDDYQLTYIFNKLSNEEDDDCVIDQEYISTLYSPRLFDKSESKHDIYLPFLFSKYYKNEPEEIDEDSDDEQLDIVIEDFDENEEEGLEEDSDIDKFKISEELLNMISPNRFKDHHICKEIGRCLSWAAKGKKKGLLLWIQKTQESKSDFDDFVPNYKNTSFNSNTIRTLAYYAKIDSPTRYKAWNELWINKALEKATSCHDLDIAKVLYTMYWLEFVYDEENVWYHFTENRWVKLGKSPIELQRYITSIITRIDILRKNLINKSLLSKDDSDKKTYNDLILKCSNLYKKLKNSLGRNSIMNLAKEFFFERGFSLKLDKNPRLLGCPNGIIEVVGTKVIFRDTRPDDYVSIVTKVKFDKRLKRDSKCVVDCYNLFLHIFDSNHEVVTYILKYFASFIKAYNKDKIFMSFIGNRGNNGKSTIKRLIEETLGPDLCWTFPISLITGTESKSNNNSSGACPELVGSEKARVGFLQEPSNTAKINSSKTKELTGDDTVYMRQLYKEGKVAKIMFKLIMNANRAIQLQDYDQAMRNRCVFVEFLNSYLDDAPDDIEEQKRTKTYKTDANLDDKIANELSKGMLWLMFNYYELYANEGLKTLPETIKKYTEGYWRENDAIVNFIDTCIVRRDDDDEKDDGIKVKFLYNIFARWYEEEYGGQVPRMEKFKPEVNLRIGGSKRNKWYGYVLTDFAINLVAEYDIS